MRPKATGKSNNKATDNSIELVQRILTGSTEAWHEFLDRYSGLIYSIVRRQLAAEDEDDVRSVYVDVLKQLYDRDLARYSERSDLPTWLMVLAKRRSFDHLRARYGRIRKPAGFAKLTDLDREVLERLRLFAEFVKRCPHCGQERLQAFREYYRRESELSRSAAEEG